MSILLTPYLLIQCGLHVSILENHGGSGCTTDFGGQKVYGDPRVLPSY